MIFVGCNATKITDNEASCQHKGTVKDMSDLDGCQFLIITEKGEKLLPLNMPDDFPLKDGQQIKFSFRDADAMASICMAEDKIVEITCIKLLQDTYSQNEECLNIEHPAEVGWMKKAIEDLNPDQVVKYPFQTTTWAYLFKGKNTYLYGCTGKLICNTSGPSTESCLKKIGTNKVGTVIWQGEGVND
ncbi:MAG: hypothetical protein DHS20C18_19730 [Saprospiraceae bacterium]|nr:MAG: hypothetical protein DHS20C18_19730 [Saprospiraceae bacterium]